MGKIAKPRIRKDTSTKARRAKVLKTLRPRVRFVFIGNDKKKYTNENSRIKINQDGGVSCVIRDAEGKWVNNKGTIVSIRIYMEKPIVYVK